MKKMGKLGFAGTSSIKRKTILLTCLILLVGFIAAVVKNYNSKPSLETTEQAQSSRESSPLSVQENQDVVSQSVDGDIVAINEKDARKNSALLKILKSDFTIGDKNAPVLFIEYASLSCPHCATFTREAFEKLKVDFIDSGKVLFIYRDFPLNHPALAAAMIAQCRAAEGGSDQAAASEKFYSAVKILFRTQDSWAFDQKFIEKLETIFKLDGMTSQAFKECLANKKLQEEILQRRMEVSKELALKSTPTFFVNGKAIDGYVDYKSIKELVEKELASGK